MIRMAMVGYWHVHARDYEREALAQPDCPIVAVWDDDAARGAAEAARVGAPFLADLESVLADPGIDAVIVTAATARHRELLLRAIAAGKHVFVEKVIAASGAEAREIVDAANAAGVHFAVCLQRIGTAWARGIEHALCDGVIGTPLHTRIRVGHDGGLPAPGQPAGWLPPHFWDPAEAHGGALLDLGAHPLYLTRLWLGMPATVQATFGHATGRALEDQAAVTMGYANGAVAVAEVSFIDRPGNYWIEAHGTDGSLHFDWSDGRVRVRRPGATRRDAGEEIDLALPLERPTPFETWVTRIRTGTMDPENARIGVDLSRLAEAAYRSAASGRRVDLTEVAGG